MIRARRTILSGAPGIREERRYLMFKRELWIPIVAIVLLSLGGWLLHMKAHGISFDPTNPSHTANFVPFIAGFLGVIAAPLLLSFKGTFVVGYCLNGMSVIVGAITMASFSLARLPSPVTIGDILTGTLLAQILVLFPKLSLGQIVLLHYYPRGMGRLFTGSWWLRHFIYLSAIFAIGNRVWR
jgi:hypothetical protein